MKHEQDHLDKMLRQFPRHKLSEKEQREMHDSLRKSLKQRTRPINRPYWRTRITVGLVSFAALVLLSILGLNLFSNGFMTGEKNVYDTLNHSNVSDALDKSTPQIGIDNAPKSLDIETLSDVIIDALDKRDMDTIANYVHPDKGLLFSPYVNITDEAVVLEQSAVSIMLEQDDVFNWGNWDGKGTPIELTATEFFDEFLDMTPYQNPDDILINDIQQRGNTINNIKDIFPDAQVIEYYNEGSEEYAGIDWSSVHLVYETDTAGNLKLVAIVRDMWTI